ncbi:MAG: hypothetical protein ACXVFU_00385 [Nocardioidaceae bacterium]
MIKFNTIALSQPAGFGMPMSGRVRVDASVMTAVDATRVCGYRHIGTAAVLTGVFPGPSAWSPPI